MNHTTDAGRRAALKALTLLVPAMAATAASADTYPSRPVMLINPYPPGGGADVTLRLLAAELSQELGQSFVVDSKPGAGATISAGYVARSAPDGYTLLMSTSQHAVSPWLFKNLPYNLQTSLAPITTFAESPLILIVRADANIDSLDKLVAQVKSKGATMNYGSSGPAGLPHLAGVMFCKTYSSNVTHIPFPGTAPAFTALLGSQIDFLFADISVLPSISAGKVKALAVTSEKRMPTLGNVPTMAESVPGFVFTLWAGLDAPAGTPRPIIDRLNAAVVKVTQGPAFQQKLAELGSQVRVMTPEAFTAFRAVELAKFEQLVKESGVKLE